MSARGVLALGVLSALALGHGQASAAAPVPAAPAASTGQAPPPALPQDATDLNLALENRPDGYVYNAQGRRDPFINLTKSVVGKPSDSVRPSGIAGFVINEVSLRGIVEHPSGSKQYIALLLGPDGKTYFPKSGQRLYDGVITAIDATTVYFRQEVTDPLSPEKTKEVKKTLYPSEEAK
jgi:hypothetical protein